MSMLTVVAKNAGGEPFAETHDVGYLRQPDAVGSRSRGAYLLPEETDEEAKKYAEALVAAFNDALSPEEPERVLVDAYLRPDGLDEARCMFLRCRSRSGSNNSEDESKFVRRMFEKYPKWYAKTEPVVFNDTAPFGSSLLRPEEPGARL